MVYDNTPKLGLLFDLGQWTDNNINFLASIVILAISFFIVRDGFPKIIQAITKFFSFALTVCMTISGAALFYYSAHSGVNELYVNVVGYISCFFLLVGILAFSFSKD